MTIDKVVRLGTTEKERVDPQPQLVQKIVLHHRLGQLAESVLDDVPVELLLQPLDLGYRIYNEVKCETTNAFGSLSNVRR